MAPQPDDLQATWPSFLDLLDPDPKRAWEGFYAFAWKLLQARPPRLLRSLQPADQENVIAEVIVHCTDDHFRRLRTYQDKGKPFAAWLVVVAHHKALDWIRRYPQPGDEPKGTEPEDQRHYDKPVDPGLRERVSACRRRLGEKCQRLIELWADYGYRPREIAEDPALGHELGYSPDENKRVSDDLRYCKKKLKGLLREEGLGLGDA
jgi:DNA-directed RNA polymerase specialized sigma24 family protein